MTTSELYLPCQLYLSIRSSFEVRPVAVKHAESIAYSYSTHIYNYKAQVLSRQFTKVYFKELFNYDNSTDLDKGVSTSREDCALPLIDLRIYQSDVKLNP